MVLSLEAIRNGDRGYVAYHAPRYQMLLDLLARHGLGSGSKVLDIGRGRLTSLIHEAFGARVDSLGFGADGETVEGRHFNFDLNLSQNDESWLRNLPTYDYVVMAEVIEHLHTAPQRVLAFLKTLVSPTGLLILQTPNAASLTKRVKLILGRNPYEMIRLDPTDPGHVREYTVNELRRLTAEAGFQLEEWLTGFYFDARYARHGHGDADLQPVVGRLKNLVYPRMPKRMREGITMVLRPAP